MEFPMSLFTEISTARTILELPEYATMDTIKSNYRRLLRKWHPDTCDCCKDSCEEMTKKIISAYKVIMRYCMGYQYSFSQETVSRHTSPEEWWLNRFGEDPLWSASTKIKQSQKG